MTEQFNDDRIARVRELANTWLSEADSLDQSAPVDGAIEIIEGRIVGREPNAEVVARRRAYANEIRNRATSILKAIGDEP